MRRRQAVEALDGLAQDTRLRIVRHLVRCGPAGAAAGAIGDAVGAAPSRLSFHLAALERAGLVSARRISRSVCYRADFERLGMLIGYLLSDCCNDHPIVRACCGIDRHET
jgi:ArsR family transcriptional regulator, arsenate/arsenite/antimonite-responsive transcriptional repressor